MSSRANDLFAHRTQQDVQEFLKFLLNTVHEAEIEADLSVPLESAQDPTPRLSAPHRSMSQVFTDIQAEAEPSISSSSPSHRRSMIQDLFEGGLKFTTKCCECECETTRTEAFLDLSLPVSADGRQSLCSALTGFACNIERLSGANKFFCLSCNHLTEAVRSLKLDSLPPIVTVHFNRTASDGRSKVRICMDRLSILTGSITDPCSCPGALFNIVPAVELT